MDRRWIGLWAVGGVVLLVSGAQADLLRYDPNAMSGWKGYKTFDSEEWDDEGIEITSLLNVQVDYAVYAPGQFTGDDPSGGTEYVYAYQITNELPADPDLPIPEEVRSFSVGVGPYARACNIGFYVTPSALQPGLVGGVLPTSVSFGPNSARWFFDLDSVAYGEHSVVLLFTSPCPPRLRAASVIDNGLSDQNLLPSPTPEPASLALLALGGLGMAGPRLRRRFRGRG